MDIIEAKRYSLNENFISKFNAHSKKHKCQSNLRCWKRCPEWPAQKNIDYQRENLAIVQPFDHINTVSTRNVLKLINTDYLWVQNDIRQNTDPTKIIHVHLFTSDGRAILIKRNCGRWAPISGEMEKGENCKRTAFREIKEETGLIIDHICVTDHSFKGISPKGKKIFGTTCFAILPKSFSSSNFKFNNEIVGSILLSTNEALLFLIEKSYPEAAESFQYIMNHNLNHIGFK